MSSFPTRKRGRRLPFTFVMAVLFGAIAWLAYVEWRTVIRRPVAAPSGERVVPAPTVRTAVAPVSETAAVPGPTAVRAFGVDVRKVAEPLDDERSPLADGLHAPESDPRVDLAIVGNLFAHYLAELRELPVGNNAEITAALAGDNARAYAVLPPNHPAIDRDGELLDRWGTPYFFHQVADDVMEIVSAGPDHRRFTTDDLVWPKHEPTAEDSAELAGP